MKYIPNTMFIATHLCLTSSKLFTSDMIIMGMSWLKGVAELVYNYSASNLKRVHFRGYLLLLLIPLQFLKCA